MNNKIKSIFSKFDEVVSRYPMILVMSFIATLCAITLVETTQHNVENSPLIKLLTLSLLGISLFFALKMASQRFGKWWLFEIFGVIILVILYFILPKTSKDYTEVYTILLSVVFLLSHLLVSFSAFLKQNHEKKFWNFNQSLFINIFQTVVFTAVLVGGIELAILAVANLFDFKIDYKNYYDVFFIFGIFGSTFIFLLFNKRGLQDLEKEEDFPVILKFFTQFILIPLLIIYVVILYFYSIKILINWELPRGWVSYLILAYSIVGIFALLLVHPLKEQTAKSWVKLFSKIFYITLVPLLVLLFTAIFTRILAYGYTELRYIVLLLALWLSSVVFYFIFFKKSTIKFIPVSLFYFGLFAILFPYLNVFSVAKRSQKNQLIEILNKNKLLKNGKINFKQKISHENANEIADKISFLAIRNETQFLNNLVRSKDVTKWSENLNNKDEYALRSNVNGAFGNTNYNESENKNFNIIPISNTVDISGYDYSLSWNELRNGGVSINGDQFKLIYDLNSDNPQLKIVLNNNLEYNFAPYVVKVLSQKFQGELNQRVDSLETEGDLGKYHLKIYFKSIQVSNKNNKNQQIYIADDATVLLKNT
jgi:hypothetical protein